jgi:hydrogenase/urease accessory protein HupE
MPGETWLIRPHATKTHRCAQTTDEAWRTFPVAKLLLLLMTLCASPAFAHGISDADKQRMIDGGYLQYIWLGATHMVTGYDHLLFLFGVVFFLTTFKDIAKFVSAFTLGHGSV